MGPIGSAAAEGRNEMRKCVANIYHFIDRHMFVPVVRIDFDFGRRKYFLSSSHSRFHDEYQSIQ